MRRLQQEGREGEVISRFNWNYPPVRFAKLAYWVRSTVVMQVPTRFCIVEVPMVASGWTLGFQPIHSQELSVA
jgi:hypothetical protein